MLYQTKQHTSWTMEKNGASVETQPFSCVSLCVSLSWLSYLNWWMLPFCFFLFSFVSSSGAFYYAALLSGHISCRICETVILKNVGTLCKTEIKMKCNNFLFLPAVFPSPCANITFAAVCFTKQWTLAQPCFWGFQDLYPVMIVSTVTSSLEYQWNVLYRVFFYEHFPALSFPPWKLGEVIGQI